MRHYSLALLGLMGLAAGAIAQQAPPPKSANGTPEQLNGELAKWESEMRAVKSISAECSRTDVNRVRSSTTHVSGYVRCLKVEAGGKVDKLALVYMSEKDRNGKEVPNAYEKFICTGNQVYWFSPREQTIYVKKLGAKPADDSFLDFLFQLKAAAMLKRYEMTLVMPTGRPDPNYVYIDLKPRLGADKVEFQRARLVLYRRDYLPAQLWFEEPNGNHHTWNLSKVKANDAGVKATDFVAPDKPAGWKVEEAKDKEAARGPRLYRPKGP
jgi:TIGR03009 family protein